MTSPLNSNQIYHCRSKLEHYPQTQRYQVCVLLPLFNDRFLLYTLVLRRVHWTEIFKKYKPLPHVSWNEGTVIKYGTEGGGRDLTGPAKLLDGECSKIFQVISMGREGIFVYNVLQLF